MRFAPPGFFLFWVKIWVKAGAPPQNLRRIETKRETRLWGADITLSFYLIFFQFFIQYSSGDSQQLGCFHSVSAGRSQSIPDQLPFKRLFGRTKPIFHLTGYMPPAPAL